MLLITFHFFKRCFRLLTGKAADVILGGDEEIKKPFKLLLSVFNDKNVTKNELYAQKVGL